MNRRPPVAIVGIGGLFPDSPDLDTFWNNVREGVDTSREVPDGRWVLPPELAFDPERGAPDKVYSTRACFLDEPELDLTGLRRITDAGISQVGERCTRLTALNLYFINKISDRGAQGSPL